MQDTSSKAVLGGRPHARIDMSEVRNLKSDPARLIKKTIISLSL
ncbi:replication protein C, IncQ-type [Aeromonas encheleia]